MLIETVKAAGLKVPIFKKKPAPAPIHTVIDNNKSRKEVEDQIEKGKSAREKHRKVNNDLQDLMNDVLSRAGTKT